MEARAVRAVIVGWTGGNQPWLSPVLAPICRRQDPRSGDRMDANLVRLTGCCVPTRRINMSNEKLEVLTPQNSQMIFIDQQPQRAFGVQSIDRQTLKNNVVG